MRARTITEALNFNRDVDPKDTIGIGMMGQIKHLAKSQDKNPENMDEVAYFLSCAQADRYDLMDFLLSQGLDINSQEHEILRVLAWTEKDEILIHIVNKRGADLDGAIKDADAHNEWKTVRRLEEIKEQIEKTRPTPVYEDQNFERGIDPRASMELGGINFGEQLVKMADEWEEEVQKIVLGRTITAIMTEVLSSGRDGNEKKNTVTVQEIFNIYTMGMMSGRSNWNLIVIGTDGKKYTMELDQKIYIK